MKGTRALSFLLALAMLASLVIPGSLVLPAKAEDTDNGMRISKTATKNDDGTYTITLEAYATGSKVISEVKSDVPTDIVLVLDQSGSMAEDMYNYDFRAYTNKTNSDYYKLRHNGGSKNLYYQLDDGGYATVSVQKVGVSSYNPIEDENNSYYYQNRNNLYVIYEGEYRKVTVDRTWNYGDREYTYTYKVNGSTILNDAGAYNVPDFGTYGPLYLSRISGYAYTYTYTDENSVTQTIGTSEGDNTKPTEFTLYERYEVSSTTRLAALQSAVTGFADSVAAKAKGADGQFGTADDVNHRIAVVGFATGNYSNNSDYPKYENTELFIGSTQYNYNVNASSYYSTAFQDMNTEAGYNNVIASKNALDARGATYPNYGLNMANGIFNAYPIPANEKRNRVVVLFTDGAPGYTSYDSDVAGSAITSAATLKNNSVTVYSVGIFDGADATSAGSSDGGSPDRENWFMQNVSSNNGKVHSPSYYLSAADAGTLSNIFEQIASNIESGGSSATLTEQAVVKDIIAPQFTLPTGATADDITLKTYAYIGENQWSENEGNAMGATCTVNGDQVSVTGFNFSENWCGTVDNNGKTEYRGSKLVISFTVAMKTGFLGGNGVETNASAGVYENSSATDPIMTFEKPTVDIPIENVTVTPAAKNVYLLQDVSAETLKSGATISVGGVSLNLSEENYGLEAWQNEYVEIAVVVTDKDSNEISTDGFTGLTEDNTYTISVTVTPKTSGTATAKSNTGTGAINVFKPVLTYQDSEVYYGDVEPVNYNANKVGATIWKHNGTASTEVTMIGVEPTLVITYTPDPTKVVGGKINTKQDIPVDVTVKIGDIDVTQYVTFAHNNCDGKTCAVPEGKEFLLHVKTCSLIVTKSGGDSTEPYVFTVLKDGKEYSEVTIVGNTSETIVELPVGTYTIQEDTGWSWRYAPSYSVSSVTLSKDVTSGTITCTNTNKNDRWLNGFSSVEKNISGVNH